MLRPQFLELLLVSSLGVFALCEDCPTIYIRSSKDKDKRRGNFSSYNHPEPYHPDIECHIIFQGDLNDRIKISFSTFDLRDKNVNTRGEATGCLMDYVDLYVVNMKTNVKQWERRMCGDTLPESYISVYQRIDLVMRVRTKKQGNHIGFKGTYEFVDEQWQPFNDSSRECGETYITGIGGVLESPGFGQSIPPNIECTWTIRVKDHEMILLNVLDLYLGQTALDCGPAYLYIWNGFASPAVEPDERVCGRLHFYDRKMFEFTSTHFRVVLRFKSGNIETTNNYNGVRLAWTAVTRPTTFIEQGTVHETCPDAACEGGEYCLDSDKMLCNPLPKYCIDHALICDGIVNCGARDKSDEDEYRCALKWILMGIVLILLAVLAAIPVIYLRLKKSKEQRKANAKAAQDRGKTSTAKAEYQNTVNDDHDKFRYKQASSYTPVRKLAAPGYIAVYSPDKQAYSIYDEYDSDTCLDRSDSRENIEVDFSCNSTLIRGTPSVPQPPVRTCTLPAHSPLVAMRMKEHTSLCPLTPPESDIELDMYSTVVPNTVRLNQNGGPYARNNVYTTTPRANPRSVTATV